MNIHSLLNIHRRAKLGKIQEGGGLQMGSQELTKGGLQYFNKFYALKISAFQNFYAKRLKKGLFLRFYTIKLYNF